MGTSAVSGGMAGAASGEGQRRRASARLPHLRTTVLGTAETKKYHWFKAARTSESGAMNDELEFDQCTRVP